MKVYGYKKGSEELIELSEVSLLCTMSELEKMAGFVNNVKKEQDLLGTSDYFHAHYRDWDREWEKGSSDLIIVTTASQIKEDSND